MDTYAKQALLECNSEECMAHPGGTNGRAYWNVYSSQFMFVPKFCFPTLPRGCKYLYTAKDKNGLLHTFTDESSEASLAPIWKDIPEGFVTLTVEALDSNDNVLHVAGVRTFYKCAPFPGRSAYPAKTCSYRECAKMAFRYVYNDPAVKYWLDHGLPKPDYAHNAYPAKTIESIIRAMVAYASLEPENADNAIKLARRAADYLLSITPGEDEPLAFLPPTYSFKDLNAESVNKVAPAAEGALGTTMMIYPISAAGALLTLYEATNDKKYYDATLRIAEYYKRTVLPCGSWYLLFDCKTGKPLSENICIEFRFVNFFAKLYKMTNDECWHELEIAHFNYIKEACLKTYKWEGQFEDVKVSGNYKNLTHFAANNIIGYIADNLSDDKNMVAEAIDLMRFIEDQFVLWGEFPRWNPNAKFVPHHTPAGLEQYFCYGPIDSSAVTIMTGFTNMYRLTKDRLYLEKALTLADTVTRRMDMKTGQSPTFWIGEDCSEGKRNYWINCQIHVAFSMMKIAELTEAEGIE